TALYCALAVTAKIVRMMAEENRTRVRLDITRCMTNPFQGILQFQLVGIDRHWSAWGSHRASEACVLTLSLTGNKRASMNAVYVTLRFRVNHSIYSGLYTR